MSPTEALSFSTRSATCRLDLQPKLLRLLQEHEFERLGSTRTIRVDVRIIAATNRRLAEMVSDGRFRDDLYYRLRVFPIIVPPLRDHREDIPALVRHFVKRHSARLNKPIKSIATEAMDALMRWHWPGNVRELENFIERAVILTQGAEPARSAHRVGVIRCRSPRLRNVRGD